MGRVGQGKLLIFTLLEQSESKIARAKNNEKRGGWGRRAHIASRAERGELRRCLILKKGSNLRINRAPIRLALLAQGKRGGCMGGARDEKSILSEAEGSPLLGTIEDCLVK